MKHFLLSFIACMNRKFMDVIMFKLLQTGTITNLVTVTYTYYYITLLVAFSL